MKRQNVKLKSTYDTNYLELSSLKAKFERANKELLFLREKNDAFI